MDNRFDVNTWFIQENDRNPKPVSKIKAVSIVPDPKPAVISVNRISAGSVSTVPARQSKPSVPAVKNNAPAKKKQKNSLSTILCVLSIISVIIVFIIVGYIIMAGNI